MKNKYFIIILLSGFLSSLVALIMTGIAWLMELQGEKITQSDLEFGYLLGVGASWFIPTFFIVVIAALVCHALYEKIRKSNT